jgi:5-formyltetrahydrofolate cyclo-ligase
VKRRFDNKDEARRAVWDALVAQKVARFPFPPQGRIPNFAGAEEAARRLFELAPWRDAARIKVNPDAPQRHVREEALRRGITVFVPTPRLRGDFKMLDPEKIPEGRLAEAARLTGMDAWAREVPLQKLPGMDAIVAGSVAVTRDGRRCGKGGGYSDIEFAILRELGHPPAPVATTVHPLQIVGDFPLDSNDLALSAIVTPIEAIVVENPLPPPEGIEWDRVTEADLEAMPVLRELKKIKQRRRA